MKWIRERDALIAQTLAFVQSVSSRKDAFRQPDTAASKPALSVDIVSVEAMAIDLEVPQPVAPPPQPLSTPPPRTASDFRSEMQARIASFRQHQERFEREREEYCAATLTRLRTAIRDAATPPPAQK